SAPPSSLGRGWVSGRKTGRSTSRSLSLRRDGTGADRGASSLFRAKGAEEAGPKGTLTPPPDAGDVVMGALGPVAAAGAPPPGAGRRACSGVVRPVTAPAEGSR